jgi:putative membrane protein
MTHSQAETDDGKASDHLANERTFLACIRPSLSIIVLGFVVAKFGITLGEFLRVQGSAIHESWTWLMMGVGFMVMGILMALSAAVRYQATMQRLKAGQFKPASAKVTIWGLVAALFGIILTAYLIYTARVLRMSLGGSMLRKLAPFIRPDSFEAEILPRSLSYRCRMTLPCGDRIMDELLLARSGMNWGEFAKRFAW